jgi:hypothetical protein
MKKTIYFQSKRDEYFHELGDDYPARTKDGTHGKLGDMLEHDDIEVFINSAWVAGWVRNPPTTFDFRVSVVSFEPETEVWKTLEGALSKFHGMRNSPMPWTKITPPSRQIPQIESDEAYIVIAREDRTPLGTPGRYTLATRAIFKTAEEADEYAAGISPSREPMVVPGRFNQLRK